MPSKFRVLRDLPLNFSRRSGVTWGSDVFASSDVIGLDSGSGLLSCTISPSGNYRISLGANEKFGTAAGDVWNNIDVSAGTAALSASTYYVQGATGAVRQTKVLLGYQLSVKSSNSADTGNVYLRGLGIDGEDLRETLTLDGTNSLLSSYYYDQLLSLSKDTTTGLVTVSDAQGNWVRLGPKQTESRFTRIQFDQTPSASGSLVLVYKRKVRDLIEDGDTPMLSGIDQALIGYALGDMNRKNRQYNKAAACYQEADALMKIARDRETHQQARTFQLIPADLGNWQTDDLILS